MKSLSKRNLISTNMNKVLKKYFSSSAEASQSISQKFHNIYVKELGKIEEQK